MNQSNLYYNRFQYLLWALLVIALFHLIFSTEYFPIYHIDDTYYIMRAYTQWTEDFYTMKHMEYHPAPLRTSILHAILYGSATTIFDENIYAHRYVSLALSIVVLALIFQVFKRLSNTQTALATVIVFALTPNFLSAAHIARPDMLVIILLWLGLWLQSRSDNQWAIFASATLAGMAVVVHPIGILAVIAMLTYRVFPLDYKQLQRNIRPIGAGFMLAGIVFVLDNFPYLSYLLSAEYHAKTIDPHIKDCWICRFNFLFTRDIYLFIRLPLVLILLILISGIDRITRQKWDMASKKCLLLFLVMLTSMVMLGRVNQYYLILFTPFLWFVIIYRMLAWGRTGKIAYGFLVASFLTLWLVVFYRADYQFDNEQYIDDIKKISAPYMNKETTVVGSPGHWFLFRDNKFYLNNKMKRIGLPCNALYLLRSKTGHSPFGRDSILKGHLSAHKVGQVSWRRGKIFQIYYRPSC